MKFIDYFDYKIVGIPKWFQRNDNNTNNVIEYMKNPEIYFVFHHNFNYIMLDY